MLRAQQRVEAELATGSEMQLEDTKGPENHGSRNPQITREGKRVWEERMDLEVPRSPLCQLFLVRKNLRCRLSLLKVR